MSPRQLCSSWIVPLTVVSLSATRLSAQATDFEGLITTENWLVLGPFTHSYGCDSGPAAYLGNHIAPAHIGCEYPEEGDEIDYDAAEAVSTGYVGPGGVPAWRRFDEFGAGLGNIDLEADVTGALDDVMSWLVTYVEYAGDRPTFVDLCIGSDDVVQVWIDSAVVHNNPVCRGVGTCQDTVSVFVQPGVHRIAMGIWERGGSWDGRLGLRQNGLPIIDGDTDEWVFLGVEGGVDAPANCDRPGQPVRLLTCRGSTDDGAELTWVNPEENDPDVEIEIFSGDTVKTVPGDATSATLTADELGEDGNICLVNTSGIATCCSLTVTDDNGFIRSTHWLAVGPFSHAFGCGTGSGNFIAPSVIGCEYPAAGDELLMGYDPGVASSSGVHALAPQEDSPIWYPWNDGADDAVLDLDQGPAGNLDLHMQWMATYVEYLGDAPVDTNLCVGSDDGVQVWINGKLVHNNNVCRSHSLSCQDTAPVTLAEPGLYCIRAGVWENGGGWKLSLALQDNLGTPILDGDPDWIFHGKNRPNDFEDLLVAGTECSDCVSGVLDVACESGRVGPGTGLNVSWTNPDDCDCSTDIRIQINGITVATASPDQTSVGILDSRLPDPPFGVEVVNCSGFVGSCSSSPGYNPQGFVSSWLHLGPFAQQDGASPGCDLMQMDHLTDGDVTELDVEPVAGDEVETDFFPGSAASLGLNAASQCTDCNPGGIPTWHEFTDVGDQFDVNVLVSPGDNQMSYGMFYIDVEEDITVDIGVASDDAIQVLAAPVGDEMVELHCNSVARGGGSPNTVQDLIQGVELFEGQWKFMVKVFEGGGGHNWRFRFEQAGRPVVPGVLSLEPEGAEPPAGASLKPGDVNGDGTLNIADAIALLGFLFSGGAVSDCLVVPGSDPRQLTAVGIAMFDYNGDGGTTIADAVAALGGLFSGGGPHALGEDCVTIAGACVSNCVQ